jgi:DNA-binding beta-propeller fold protein YncE
MKHWMLPLLVMASSIAAARDAGSYIYVQTPRAVDVVSIDKLEKVGSIAVGDQLSSVAGSPDGKTLFVNASLDMGHPQGRSHLGRVLAFSTANEQLLWSVGVDGDPHYFDVSRDGTRLFQPLWDRYYALVLDTKTGREIDRWWGYVGLHDMRAGRDDKRAYASNSATGGFYIFDGTTGESLAVHNSVRGGIRPYVLNADESLMYYQIEKFHGFDVMDLKSGKVVKSVELPALPAGTKLPQAYPYSYDHGIALSPDGGTLFAAGTVANYVAVYSVPDLQLRKTIATGTNPRQLLVTRDGKYLVTANTGEGTLGFIDAKTLQEVKRVKTGDRPQFMTQIDVPEAKP